MNGPLRVPARLLLKAALAIFVVTIVIGILNGIDVWNPPRTLLLTHVHAGTLGWITLAVTGVALLMFGGEGDTATGTRVAQAMTAATVLYLIAFATTTNVLRPIGGTVMLAAIVYTFVWVTRRMSTAPKTVAALALYLALISLMLGAILGVLLGLFIANGSIPGLDVELAGNLAGAHPAAMLAGYLLLAGFGIVEWRLESEPALARDAKLGVATAWALFVAGIIFNIALIFTIDPLIQLASMLQAISVIVFIVRMRRHIKPSAWKAGGVDTFARWSVVYLVVGIALLMYVVQLFVSGQLDPESGEGANYLIAFDHSMFLGLMTNVLFAITGLWLSWSSTQRVIAWAVNLGLAGFLVGLMSESAPVKRMTTPIMGLALLVAIYTRLVGREDVASSA